MSLEVLGFIRFFFFCLLDLVILFRTLFNQFDWICMSGEGRFHGAIAKGFARFRVANSWSFAKNKGLRMRW